jgi:drug/metabolite transporter (DMT)-like permease
MKHYLAGLAVLGYVLLTATQGVALGSLVQRSVWNPIILMVMTFGVVALIFNLVQLYRGAGYLRLLRTSAKEVLWLNLLSAANFVSYYWAIRTVPVSSHASIALGVGPLVVLLLGRGAKGRNDHGEVISAVGLALSLLLIAGALMGRAGSFDLAMSFVCGFSLVLTLFSQRRLKALGWSPGQMMASRFFLLIAVGFVLAPGLPAPAVTPQTAAIQVALLAGFGTVIPLYLLTWGQCHTRPLTSTLLLYIMPLLMVAGELVEARVTVSAPIIGGILATCVFLAIGYLSKVGG